MRLNGHRPLILQGRVCRPDRDFLDHVGTFEFQGAGQYQLRRQHHNVSYR